MSFIAEHNEIEKHERILEASSDGMSVTTSLLAHMLLAFGKGFCDYKTGGTKVEVQSEDRT